MITCYLYFYLFLSFNVLHCAEETPSHVQQLHRAVENKEKHAVEALLGQHPEDADTPYEGLFPLHRATRHQDLVIVRVLLEHKPFIDPSDATGSTPLHLVFAPDLSIAAVVAAHGGHLPDAQLMIKDMSEITIKNIVLQLVNRGAAIYLPNNANKTPFDLAQDHPEARGKMLEVYNERQQKIKEALEEAFRTAQLSLPAAIKHLIADFTG